MGTSVDISSSCLLGEGSIEAEWSPVPNARYRAEWATGEALLDSPSVRVSGRINELRIVAERGDGTLLTETTISASAVAMAGDTLVLRARTATGIAWQPISCISRRVERGGEQQLARDANLVVEPVVPNLAGSARLLPATEGDRGDLVAASTLDVTRFDRNTPFVPVPYSLGIVPSWPGAVAVDHEASYVATDAGIWRIPKLVDGGAVQHLTSAQLAGRRVVAIVPDATAVWVLAASDGTPQSQPSRFLRFDSWHADAVPSAAVTLPDDSAAPDFRFDSVGWTPVNRTGTQVPYTGLASDGAIAWSVALGLPIGVRSLVSSALYTFVATAEDGVVAVYPRLDFRDRLAALYLPDTTELEVVGYTEPYRRPSPP